MWIFVKKSFWEESSYRFTFLIKIFKIFFIISVIFYFSSFFEKKLVSDKNFNLFGYLFTGQLFYQFLLSNLKKPSSFIINEQYKGTLELLFNSAYNPYLVIVYSNIYTALFNFLMLNIYLFGGIFFFKLNINLTFSGYLKFFSVLSLVYVYLFALGTIGSALTLLIKKSDPFTSALIYYFTFTGSLYFPSEVLPDIFKLFGKMFPVSDSLNLVRDILFKNKFDIDIFIFISFHTIVIVLISYFILGYAIKIAKKYNSLGVY